MNYGMYLSAAGTLASMHRQDVMANNLANVNTIGFKPDELALRARLPERIESDALIDPQLLLEQLGGGTFLELPHFSSQQGLLTQTRNDLDLALEGDGFFVVQTGKTGSDSIRLTRDGRFTRNAAGELVMSGTGMRVLDTNDRPIRLNGNGPVRIDANGSISQGEQIVAQIQVAHVKDHSALKKIGNNLFQGAGKRVQSTDTAVKQGYTEASGVDPIMAMNKMISASKAVAANATMMQYHDHILGQAINTFGRVA